MPSNCVAGELLKVSWTARRSNQSILREINPEYSLEGLMLKLKFLVIWCEQTTHCKSSRCWERLRAEEEGVRGRDGWMASLMQGTWTWASFRRWFLDMSPSSPQLPVLLLKQSFLSQQWVLAIERQAAKHEFSNKRKDYYFELRASKTQQILESSSISPSIA